MKKFDVVCFGNNEDLVFDTIQEIGIDVVSMHEFKTSIYTNGWFFECQGTRTQYKKASKIFKEMELNGHMVLAKIG